MFKKPVLIKWYFLLAFSIATPNPDDGASKPTTNNELL